MRRNSMHRRGVLCVIDDISGRDNVLIYPPNTIRYFFKKLINKMEQEIVKQTYVNSSGQKAPYRRPSIKIIEVEVQQLITASDVQSVQSTNWQPETDEGEITDGSGN